ncbi:hypothetical protein GCM10009416_02760 [Craurococcus roseus]|uniref:Histone H1 n=1 Tax=Craurococcus roseus TaxID=77585 RepID=A0ABP3PMV8_9PROT
MTGHDWLVQGPAMPNRSSKRPRDLNQLAKLLVDIATGEQEDPLLTPDGKNAAAVALGRRGGLKGGAARAEKLTQEQRREIARVAAAARWKRDDR